MFIFLVVSIAVIILGMVLNSPQYKGKCGERIVKNKLEGINGYNRVINNIMLNDNGKSRQIDHIVITRQGVFVLETKNYGGTIYGQESWTEWKEYLNQKCYTFKNPIHQNYGHKEIVKKLLEDLTDKVYPIVVFIRRCNLKLDVKSTVLYDDQVKNFIENKEKILTTDEIDEIYKTLMENRIKNKETIRNHNYNVKHYIEYKNNIANDGKCPRCGAELVKRTGKSGEFYGCTNYPNCKYTKNV